MCDEKSVSTTAGTLKEVGPDMREKLKGGGKHDPRSEAVSGGDCVQECALRLLIQERFVAG